MLHDDMIHRDPRQKEKEAKCELPTPTSTRKISTLSVLNIGGSNFSSEKKIDSAAEKNVWKTIC